MQRGGVGDEKPVVEAGDDNPAADPKKAADPKAEEVAAPEEVAAAEEGTLEQEPAAEEGKKEKKCYEVAEKPCTSGGGRRKKQDGPKPSNNHVQLAGQTRKRVIYVGSRGGKYVRMCGEYVLLSVARERANMKKAEKLASTSSSSSSSKKVALNSIRAMVNSI